MNLVFSALAQQRLIFSFVVLLSSIGAIAWFNMDRQEDPSFPYRIAQVVVSWPGAEPSEVERMVLNPLEEEIAQIEEVNQIEGIARLGVAIIRVRLKPSVYDTDNVWDRVRVAIQTAEQKFPADVRPPQLNDRVMDTHGIVLAVTGSENLLELLEAARALRRDLFQINNVARVDLLGDPGEQLLIRLDPARAGALGVDPAELAQQLAERNQTLAGGSLDVQGRSLLLTPLTDFDSLEELLQTPIQTSDGALLPLSELADVSLEVDQPASERIWLDGVPSVALGVVIPEDQLNAVEFGEQVRAHLDKIRAKYAPLEIQEMFFQPYWVEARLSELGRSLLIGMVTVAAILVVFMGLRLGLLVASILPIVIFSALAIFAIGGGVLHQIAIAGMVIAIGMLVDNAIVMTENLQYHLDRGISRSQAGIKAVQELASPLAAATGTTLAAFAPLLISRGDTADFTRGIPIMVMLSLVVSYFYALLVTPVLGSAVLTRKPLSDNRLSRFDRLGRLLGKISVRRGGTVLLLAGLLVMGTGVLTIWLPRDFFPSADRNQMIVDLTFPEGTRTDYSALIAKNLSDELRPRDDIEVIHVFAGFSGPRFFYNLQTKPSAPHLARLVIISRTDDDLSSIARQIRLRAPSLAPEAQIVVRRLGQGPATEADVELQLIGSDPGDLQHAAETVVATLRSTPGAMDVRHELGVGMPSMEFVIDDAEASRFGVTRAQIGHILGDATLGREFSTWRAGREPVPIRIRSPEGEQFPAEGLEGLNIMTNQGPRPISQFVSTRLDFQPSVIEHLDLRRMTAVLAETTPDVTYSQVLERFFETFDADQLPDGVELKIGGAASEAGDANEAVFTALPIGVLLLLIFLMWQFNSFRLVTIVLATVPLAAVGVVPGLMLAGQPFNFTAMLGVIALVGIVVNNAIVLIDVAERDRSEGASLADAVQQAVQRRTRPIVLTTLTTIVGLLPLTMTQSTLWPPMAWAIISGLVSSTALTLLVIPVLYRLAMRFQWKDRTAR
ncbi:MAG: efflux RND transporter permease subunit [Wenzhouxiangella sp.]|jgi:multidrug efflux pump subunit AcrB|nr:efflux RND transporter permease subunit [Wenzhouxiangella sp.]